MPGRLHVPDAAPLLDSGEKRNSWRCRGCCRSGGLPAFCVLALPRAATGAGALSVVAVRRLRQPWRRWCRSRLPARVRRALSPPAAGSPASSRAASRPGEVSAPGLAVLGRCAGWLPPVACVEWRSTAPCCFPRSPSTSPAYRTRSSRPATPATPATTATSLPQPLPRKKSTPETPYRPVAGVAAPRRESRVAVVAVLSGRPCRQARTAVPPHCLCRLSPCPVGFVQNPFVYRAKLNTAASGRIYRFDCPTSSTRVVRPNGFGRYIDRRYPTPRIGHHAPRMSMRLLFGIEDKR